VPGIKEQRNGTWSDSGDEGIDGLVHLPVAQVGAGDDGEAALLEG